MALEQLNEDQQRLLNMAYDSAVAFGDPDPASFAAKGMVESNLKPGVVNRFGYTGLYQIGNQAVKDLVESDYLTKAEADRLNLKNAGDNINTALLYRKRLRDLVGNNEDLVNIAYNAGPTAVNNAFKKIGKTDPAALAREIARQRPKSFYAKQGKIDEISQYLPKIQALLPDIAAFRKDQGLSLGSPPPFAGAAGPTLPGTGVPPPNQVAQAPQIPQGPQGQQPDPLSSFPQGDPTPLMPGAQDVISPDGAFPGTGLDVGAAGNTDNSFPLPTESPDLRNALGQLAEGGLSYNMPLGGQFDQLTQKSPLTTLDKFLDTLLDQT